MNLAQRKTKIKFGGNLRIEKTKNDLALFSICQGE